MREKVRSLYDYVMHDLKMEQLNEQIINLTRIDILLIIILIILVVVLIILGLSLKKLFGLTAKIKCLEKLKTDHRNIQIKTEEFNEEPISALHYKIRKEQPNVFKQPNLMYPVTLQELPNSRGTVRAEWTPVPMLDLKRFKEAIWQTFTFCETNVKFVVSLEQNYSQRLDRLG